MKTSPLSALGQRTTEPPVSWLMSYALARPQLISLAAGFTDSASLPVREARELLSQILDSPGTGRVALQYGTTAGDPELRHLTSARLRQQDADALSGTADCLNPPIVPRLGSLCAGKGPVIPRLSARVYSPGRMFITSGSQQLLYVVSECLCNPGDIVLVEDPTYFVYLGIVQSHGLQCRGIRMQEDGVDLAHLQATLEALQRRGEIRRVKLLYLVTYFQNPTGSTTRYANKVGALRLLAQHERAAGHPIYLLEDAAYRELRFAGQDVPSALTAAGASERVIYAGTFSKPFATGVRVGFGICPEPLLSVVLRIKANHDFGTSNLLQQLLKHALASGRYAHHVSVLRRRYARKAAVMLTAIREHFPPGVSWIEPHGGLYIWARLRRSVRTGMRSPLFKSALRHEVLYVPGELCYAEDPTRHKPNHEMRLSFGGATEPDIRTGIARLGEVLAQMCH